MQERLLGDPPEDDILIDAHLLRDSARRRLRNWAVVGPLLFVGITGYQLLVMPQQYEAITSIAVQQGQNLSSPLAALTGATSTNSKYIGLLQSRRLAEQVVDRFHLQQFYHLPTRVKTLDMLIKAVRPEDNAATGLLLLHVTLPGAPRFGSDPEHRRATVPRLVAAIANTYAAELSSYFATSDNDRDSVLLNAADQELRDARADYDLKARTFRAFVHDMSRHGSQESPLPAGSEPASDGLESGGALHGSPDSGAGFGGLFEKMQETQAEIAQLEASKASEEAGTHRLLGNLEEIPLDDPFLRTARDRVYEARRNYTYLVNGQELAAENPQVVAAAQRLKQAQDELKRQADAELKNLTTTRNDVNIKLDGLKARLATIRAAMDASERKLPTRRLRAVDQAFLEKEMEFAAKRLEATEVKGAELRLTAVSGKSRLNVVDAAYVPDSSQPGIMKATLIGLILTLLPLGISIVVDYLRQVRQRAAIAFRIAGAPSLPAADSVGVNHQNGSGVAAPLHPTRQELPPE
jgi:uncharacterized protein involved in exopolysaccharide biosynthesis